MIISIRSALRMAGYSLSKDLTGGERIDTRNKQTGDLVSAIIQDRHIVPQYTIIRRVITDGTAMFIHEMIGKAVNLLLTGNSYWKQCSPEEGKIPVYTIGDITLEEVEDYKKPEHMHWQTSCDELRIPVKIEWITPEESV